MTTAAKMAKRIRYAHKMAKRHAREVEARVPLYGIARVSARELIDAANIRAKRRAEALKNSGITSLPVPPPESPPVTGGKP